MNSKELFRVKIVHLILSRKPEEALESLSQYYNAATPRLRVGIQKGHGKDAGCYVASKKTIYVSDKENLYNPYLILHEFYHHLRTIDGKHKGTEKYANRFAVEYVETYKKFYKEVSFPTKLKA
jgi:hypothetical protein